MDLPVHIPISAATVTRLKGTKYGVRAMRTPNGIDAVHVMYAVDGLISGTSLRRMGLNREGYRGAKEAQKWFWNELIKTVRTRSRRFDKRKRHVK